MRIIGGKYRGKKLLDVEEISTRPTTDRVKENVFNLIPHQFTEQTTVLDIFGGSGQVGIEFASRGAKHIYINELNKNALSIIKQNIKNIDAHFYLTNLDAYNFCNTCNVIFDYIYIDGPYDAYNINELLVSLNSNTNEQTIIIVETNAKYNKEFRNFEILREKKYGNTKIWIIKRRKDEKR